MPTLPTEIPSSVKEHWDVMWILLILMGGLVSFLFWKLWAAQEMSLKSLWRAFNRHQHAVTGEVIRKDDE